VLFSGGALTLFILHSAVACCLPAACFVLSTNPVFLFTSPPPPPPKPPNQHRRHVSPLRLPSGADRPALPRGDARRLQPLHLDAHADRAGQVRGGRPAVRRQRRRYAREPKQHVYGVSWGVVPAVAAPAACRIECSRHSILSLRLRSCLAQPTNCALAPERQTPQAAPLPSTPSSAARRASPPTAPPSQSSTPTSTAPAAASWASCPRRSPLATAGASGPRKWARHCGRGTGAATARGWRCWWW